MAVRIDHFMYAAASLNEGMDWASDTFGVSPSYGGEHVGLGTRNALLSLGTCYLEIITPDPGQNQAGTFGEQLASLSGGGLVTWAAEGDLAGIASTLSECGQTTVGPKRTRRATSDGEVLAWDLLFPSGSAHGGRMPFFIDWLECENPKDTNPLAGRLQEVSISTPDAADLQLTFDAIGLDASVAAGEPGMSVSIAGRDGEIVLESSAETCRLKMMLQKPKDD